MGITKKLKEIGVNYIIGVKNPEREREKERPGERVSKKEREGEKGGEREREQCTVNPFLSVFTDP
jgi:hypothetical protein